MKLTGITDAANGAFVGMTDLGSPKDNYFTWIDGSQEQSFVYVC